MPDDRPDPDQRVLQIDRNAGRTSRERAGAAAASSCDDTPERKESRWLGYAMSAIACAAVTLIAALLHRVFDLANIVMLYLLAVVLIAVRYGRGPAVLASFLGVAAFDFFFVPPHLTFAINDAQYLLTFAIMLAVGLIIGQLTAGLRLQARMAALREERVRALYEMARELSAALTPEQIADVCSRYIDSSFDARALILSVNAQGHLHAPGTGAGATLVDWQVAQWVLEHGDTAGIGTDSSPESRVLYVPLKAPTRIRGVLAVEARDARRRMFPEQRRLLDTFARLIAIALERIHYVDVAQSTTVQIESERLRNSLLSALSHDLRTPLTALVGLADSLTLGRPATDRALIATATAVRNEALRMNALVNNLLDMARLQAGKVKMNRQWQPLEEVVGSAIKIAGALLAEHRVVVRLAADFPLLEFDAVLMERVLCNLLENAAKYTPTGSEIVISGRLAEGVAEVCVADNGPGVAPGSEKALFEKFTRGQKESSTSGVGLGLAICKAIVEAHQGTIRAENRSQGGARFVFTLPLGTPPAVELVDDMVIPGGARR